MRTLLVATLGTTLLAQQPAASNRFVPADAHVVVRIAAPSAWKREFANTRVMKALDGPTLAPLRGKVAEAWERALQEADAAGVPRELLEALATDYRGHLTIAMRFDVENLDRLRASEPTEVTGVLALSPDGSFDLGRLAAAIDAAEDGTRLTALEVAGHTFRASTDRGTTTTHPLLIDGHLVVLFGRHVERFGPAMLASTNRADGDAPRTPWSMQVDLAAVFAHVKATLANEPQPQGAPLSPARAFELSGLDALRSFTIALGADGEHVHGETLLRTGGGDPGLAGVALMEQGPPALLRRVPPAAESFRIRAIDVNALRRTFERILAAAGGAHANAFDELDTKLAERTGVRLRADLLDHVGTELLTLGDPRSVLEEVLEVRRSGGNADPDRMFAGYCIGLALRDGNALAASVDKLLRGAGLHAARKTEQYAGTPVHRLRLGVLTIEYAITPDVLLVVLGGRGDGTTHLRAVLDTLGTGDDALAPELAKRLTGLPEDWNSVGRSPVVGIVRAVMDIGLAAGTVPADVRERTREIVHGLCDDLTRLGLADLVTVGYATRTSLRTVYRW